MTRTAVITIAHGRHAHWLLQHAALRRCAPGADVTVLVAIGDPDLAAMAHRVAPDTLVVAIEADDEGLPLARARNIGAAAARSCGADVLIFLDVDCLPAAGLIGAYRQAALAPDTAPRLLCGPVTYLPPPPPEGYDLARLQLHDRPHPARPAPEAGEVILGGSHDLFWSLSFALTAGLWESIGGFHEAYVGYGGEDTDFGRAARQRGVELAWIGDARAFHQWHPAQDPPLQHLDSILRNGRIFHTRWGEWPMKGWIDEFVRQGVITASSDGAEYRAADRGDRVSAAPS